MAVALLVGAGFGFQAASVAATGSNVMGYGARALGGAGGRVIEARSVTEYRAGVEASGARIIQLHGSGTWDLGSLLAIHNPYITILGDPNLTIRGHETRVRTHDVIFDGYRAAIGDMGMTTAEADDADALTLNGLSDDVYNVVVRNSTLIWGPDIGGIAILGHVHDVTIQDNIIGEGLKYSRHSEGTVSHGGHSKGMSMFQLDPNVQPASRITITHNLITRSSERMPVIMGASKVDLVNNLIYDWGFHGPAGNPRELNVVGNYLKAGPDSGPRLVWSPHLHTANPSYYPNSVYVADNVLEGSVGQPLGIPLSVYRTTPGHALSVTPTSAPAARDYVLANAGASRSALESRIMDDYRQGRGVLFNGVDYPAPNPYWDQAGVTPTPTPTAVTTPTPSATTQATASPTANPTASATPALTPTPTASPTPTPTPTSTPSATPSPTATSSPVATPTPTPSGLPSFSHVYVIVMENKAYSQIIGNTSEAPYINSLAGKYALATNYFAIRHPSLPNYLAMWSGSTQGVTDDHTYNFSSGTTLADQIERAGLSWHVAAQNVKLPCFTGSTSTGGADGTSGGYARRHEPAISWTSVSGNASRCARITDFTHFDPTLGDFWFIVPNVCNDMHDCSIRTGDNFLKTFIPRITNSAAFANSVLFLTWDEGEGNIGGGGQVATLAISPLARAGFRSATAHTHYSLLHTIENSRGLPCLVNSCQANDLRELFK